MLRCLKAEEQNWGCLATANKKSKHESHDDKVKLGQITASIIGEVRNLVLYSKKKNSKIPNLNTKIR